jgi:hypothetical protein
VINRFSDDCEALGSIYLIAVPRDVMPPVFYGNAMLQRMRAVTLSPGAAAAAELGDGIVNIPFEDVLQRLGAQPATHPMRPVNGEILRDEQGQLYERNGSFIRRLRNLASSPEGALIETPAPEIRQRAVPPTAVEPPPVKTFHQFFRDPGESRILCWGEFKSLLQDQVSKSERLRDNHRLSCFVQVYENFVSRTPEAFARECFGDARVASQLFQLTGALADRLKLAHLMPPPPSLKQERRDGVLCAGDRVVRLVLATDPTAESAPGEAPAAVAAVSTSATRTVAEAPATAPDTVTEEKARALRKSIPECFLAPWEIQYSREQVLADMQRSESLPARVRRWTQSRRLGTELNSWRRQLWGKSLEEQLWGVRPPKGSLRIEEVFESAKAMLVAAQYDPSIMLQEWEIFWRQKGL